MLGEPLSPGSPGIGNLFVLLAGGGPILNWINRLTGLRRFRRSLSGMVAGSLLGGCAFVEAASAQVYDGPLYSGPAEGSQHWKYERLVTCEEARKNVFNTREPRVQVYLPEKGNGAGIVMLPGGGLRVLGLGEGTKTEIDAFLEQGIAVILLEYRTLQVDPETLAQPPAAPPPSADPVKFPKMEIRNANANPSPDDPALSEVLRLATADGKAALALAHERAAQWNLDPNRIGMIGTSAGGGVAFGSLLSDGPPNTKPDFIVSIFGPSLQDVSVPANAPPLYLVTEADHGPVTDGLLALFSLWKDAGAKAEIHVYEVPNFSMTVGLWGDRLFEWMVERAIIPADDATR